MVNDIKHTTSWKAIVPFLNVYTLFEITWGNGWLFLLLFLSIIPVVGSIAVLVISIITYVKLAKAFGKSGGFAVGLIFLSVIFVGILALGVGSGNANVTGTVSVEGKVRTISIKVTVEKDENENPTPTPTPTYEETNNVNPVEPAPTSYCTNCGAALPAGTTFCPNCGTQKTN